MRVTAPPNMSKKKKEAAAKQSVTAIYTIKREKKKRTVRLKSEHN